MTETPETTGDTEALSRSRIFQYAAIGFVTKGVMLPLVAYLPLAYAQETSLSLAMIGILFMIARFWDILLDPLAGYLVDRFQPPFGPRKFWVFVGGGIMFLTVPAVFAPRFAQIGHQAHIAELAFFLLVFYFGWTVMSVAHAGWPADLSQTPSGRARLIAWREWAGVIGMIGLVSVPAIVEHFGQHSLSDQLMAMGVSIMIVLPITLFLSARLSTKTYVPSDHPHPYAIVKSIVPSRNLRRVLLADLFSGGGFAVFSATSFFVFSWLGLAAHFSTLMLMYFIGMIVGVPVFLRMTVASTIRRSFAWAMTGAAMAVLALGLIPAGGYGVALAIQFLIGFFTGGYQPNLNSGMMQVAAESEKRDRTSSMGRHFALLALTNKIGYALAIGVCYPLLERAGVHAGVTALPHAGPVTIFLTLGSTAALLLLGGLALSRTNMT